MESEKTSKQNANHSTLYNPRCMNLSSLDCSISDLNKATKFPPSWFSLSRRWRSVSSWELVSSISWFKDSTFFSSCGKQQQNRSFCLNYKPHPMILPFITFYIFTQSSSAIT